MLHHAKFHGNSPKNYKVTAIYTLGTVNIPLILFSMFFHSFHSFSQKKATNKNKTNLALWLSSLVYSAKKLPDEGMILPEIMRCYFETIYRVSKKKCTHKT